MQGDYLLSVARRQARGWSGRPTVSRRGQSTSLVPSAAGKNVEEKRRETGNTGRGWNKESGAKGVWKRSKRCSPACQVVER
jgi:hypothetical protein